MSRFGRRRPPLGVVKKLTPFAMQPPIGRVVARSTAVATAHLHYLASHRYAAPTGQPATVVFPAIQLVAPQYTVSHETRDVQPVVRKFIQQLSNIVNGLLYSGELKGTVGRPKLGYQPDNSLDWGLDPPYTIKDALDALAARGGGSLASDISDIADALAAHIADAADAHDASAISVSPTGDLTSTDVQSALAELDFDIRTRVNMPGLDGVDGEDSPFVPGRDGLPGKDAVAIPGRDGDDGDNATFFPQPLDGKAGLDGRHGIDGSDGDDAFSIPGRDGRDGRDSFVLPLDGQDGDDGATVIGRDGRAAIDGRPGSDGQDGEDGAPAIDMGLSRVEALAMTMLEW